MPGICNYLPETNYASEEYNVAVILRLCFMVHVILFLVTNVMKLCICVFRSKCAVPSVAVFCNSSICSYVVQVFSK
jgi:hypothetical protein